MPPTAGDHRIRRSRTPPDPVPAAPPAPPPRRRRTPRGRTGGRVCGGHRTAPSGNRPRRRSRRECSARGWWPPGPPRAVRGAGVRPATAPRTCLGSRAPPGPCPRPDRRSSRPQPPLLLPPARPGRHHRNPPRCALCRQPKGLPVAAPPRPRGGRSGPQHRPWRRSCRCRSRRRPLLGAGPPGAAARSGLSRTGGGACGEPAPGDRHRWVPPPRRIPPRHVRLRKPPTAPTGILLPPEGRPA